MVTLTDLGTLADVAQKVDANPVALVGRFLGLSREEQQAGVPAWSWCTVAFVTGVVVAIKYGPAIKKRLSGRMPSVSE